MKNPRIIAVMSSYNRGKKITKTVQSLLHQSYPISEIIIIDDGSVEAKRVPKFNNKKIRVISLKENVGVVWGRNYGLSKASKADYILILDDDISLEKHAVKELLKSFDQQTDAIAAMPVVYFLNNKKKVWSSGSGVNLFSGQTLFDTQQFSKQYAPIQAATSVLLVKTDAIINAGWYDPLFYFCYEDADFYYRLREKNSGVIYSVRSASAYHDIPEDLSLERVAKRSYHIARGRVIFLSRHSSYFPWNLFIVLLYSLYYQYLGVKYSVFNSGFLYLKGFLDGLILSIKKPSNLTDIRYSKSLSLSSIRRPDNLQSTKVRE